MRGRAEKDWDTLWEENVPIKFSAWPRDIYFSAGDSFYEIQCEGEISQASHSVLQV